MPGSAKVRWWLSWVWWVVGKQDSRDEGSHDICRKYSYTDEQGNKVLKLDYSSKRFDHFRLPPGVSPKDVTHLNLEKTKLKTFPSIILEMPNLEELDLRHNRLKSLPPEISKLQKLKVLKVAMNSITELPEAVSEMENLEVLHLGSNELRQLPKEFGNLKLKFLWINDNYFAEFPIQITGIKTLEELDVHGNQIKMLPKEIRKLSKMSSFLIYKNRLISLPRAILALMKSKLKDFDCHANDGLKGYPRGFSQVASEVNVPHGNDNKHKPLGATCRQKQTRFGKGNKSKLSAKATRKPGKVPEDNVVEAKTQEAPAVASVADPPSLHKANWASEQKHQVPVKGQEQPPSQTMQEASASAGVGAKGVSNVYIFNGPVRFGSQHVADSIKRRKTKSFKRRSTKTFKDTQKHLFTDQGVGQSFLKVAEEVGTEWKNLARQLGYSELQISAIENQHRGMTQECCIHALDKWRQKHGQCATKEALVEALRRAGLVVIAEEIEEYLKNRGWNTNEQCAHKKTELNQASSGSPPSTASPQPTEGTRRHHSRPGSQSSSGHETGAPDDN